MTESFDYDKEWSSWGDMSDHAPTPIHTRRLIIREAARLSFQSVLDIGCGNGKLLLAVAEKLPGRRYSGADVSQNAVERARKRLAQMAFHVLDIQKAALKERFDLILLSEVIEHLEEPFAALKNIRAMCSGHLILTTPTGRRYPTDVSFGHLRHFDPEELRALAEKAGFKVVRLYRWGWPFQMLMRRLVNIAPSATYGTFVRGGNYGVFKRLASALWSALFFLNSSRWGTQLVMVAKADN